MLYQLAVVGDTSVDQGGPGAPANFTPLEEFEEMIGGGVLAVESPVEVLTSTTEPNILDVGLYVGSPLDSFVSPGEISWASNSTIHSLYPSLSGVFEPGNGPIDETFQSFDAATRTLTSEIQIDSALLSNDDLFSKTGGDADLAEIAVGTVEIEFSADFREVSGFAEFLGFGADEGNIYRWAAGFAGPLLDGLEYIASYPDLISAFGSNREAGVQHFLDVGRAEGRFDFFDGIQYIASHPDLIPVFGANRDLGTQHFIAAGFTEGRSLDDFDAAQYLANYSDLQAAFGDDESAATLHYVTAGFFENRTDDFIV